MESDEEREKAAKKAKRGKRSENVSGDEGAGGEKKKRRGKLKKSESDGEDQNEALFSGDEEEQKPRKVSLASASVKSQVLTMNIAADKEASCPRRRRRGDCTSSASKEAVVSGL